MGKMENGNSHVLSFAFSSFAVLVSRAKDIEVPNGESATSSLRLYGHSSHNDITTSRVAEPENSALTRHGSLPGNSGETRPTLPLGFLSTTLRDSYSAA